MYVRFALEGKENEYLLAWTTTPWTLPGNVALAAHPEMTYAKVRAKDGAAYWLAKDRVAAIFGDDAAVEEEQPGTRLVGWRYRPLWQGVPLLWSEEERARALQVYPAEFVSAEEGTGIVHTAVMYGQEDYELGERYQLPKRHLVAEDGTFIPEEALGPLGGKYVKDPETEALIEEHLKATGALFRNETITHAYPFCWRCKQRVLYYAHTSWFVRMSALREELLKENQTIHWEPEHLRDGRFGEWLANVKDWAISRNRFWATPLPVWESPTGARVVVDSIAALRNLTPSRSNRFWLMRHGEALSNARGFVDDGRDPENGLTGEGREAVRQAAQALKGQGITVIYTSPVRRAQETAEVVRQELGLPQEALRVDERLREVGVGDLQGQSLEKWHEVMGPPRARFDAPPAGAEPWEAVRQRAAQALFAIDEAHEGIGCSSCRTKHRWHCSRRRLTRAAHSGPSATTRSSPCYTRRKCWRKENFAPTPTTPSGRWICIARMWMSGPWLRPTAHASSGWKR
ncbi:MAG: hypothetical protein KatS3mg100_049 [Candidatus Parcubacteria bacterium]|nr:MAG: hypothetical protein KatS3mg100_049 [Candidatus Parcubacteria bacterium]